MDIPSYQVKKGDIIKIKEKSKKSPLFQGLKTILKKYQTPSWLSLDKQKLEGKVISQPSQVDIGQPGDVGMIIEFYSR